MSQKEGHSNSCQPLYKSVSYSPGKNIAGVGMGEGHSELDGKRALFGGYRSEGKCFLSHL